MNNTAFTKHEAESISSLKWYLDKTLEEKIKCYYTKFLKIGSTKLNTKLLDIGCGLGIQFQPLSELFGNYIGIDNSEYMISKAQKLYQDNGPIFINVDAIEFLENPAYEDIRKDITHVLIKNTLQFIDYDYLFKLLREKLPNGFVGIIVQTIRQTKKENQTENKSDLFKLLHCLDFVKRTKH